MTATAHEVLARAQDLGYPTVVVSGGPISTERQWQREAAFPGNLELMSRALDALEDDRVRREEQQDRWAADDARRAEAATPDPALIEEAAREARAELERYERQHPARVEALLRRLVELAEKGAAT